MKLTPYECATARKRAWTPTAVTAGPIESNRRHTIMRGLALRHLELPVAEWIREGLGRDLPGTRGCREALLSNMQDEEKHDIALGYVASVHGVDTDAERYALQVLEAARSLPDHPITTISVIERALFFAILAYNRFHGDFGIRTVTKDINRDEQVHAAVHTAISDQLGLRPSQKLDSLRAEIAQWLFQDDPDRDHWIEVSDSLMYQRKAPQLQRTKAARMEAFFEAPNTNLPNYGAKN